MIRIGRKIAIIALPSLTAISGMLLHFYNDTSWLDWVFKISLSGTVGIWTNYFAIKMLFRPYYRTAFGRQGLIPARRDDIAEAIAAAVSEELLDAEAILGYIEENNLVGKTAQGLLEYAHSWIDDPSNRTKIINAIGRYIQTRGVEQAGKLLAKAAQLIKNYSSEKLSSEKVWEYVRSAIEQELEKPEAVHLLTMIIKNLVEKNASTIALYVNNMLEEWINDQNFLVKNALKLGKGLFGIDNEMIRKELMEKVNKPSFLRDIMDVIEQNISSISAMGDDPAVKERFSAFFEEQKQRLDEWIKTEGVNTARTKIIEYLESESFWNWLEVQIDSVIGKLKDTAEEKIHSDDFRKTAGTVMLEFAEKVEIKEIVQNKVNEFELKQLEDLITKVSGENLCGIELFGGLLGMIAGLTLINQWFILGIPAAFVALWGIERSLTRSSSKIHS
ncbi:MAG: DUF445 domain-containing protein [Candidatus Aegiribacteria sp.]|nr:DUF445 domain-containing protein [Candidatus Aegiribacteria sp.]